jgi:hypothetical protein
MQPPILGRALMRGHVAATIVAVVCGSYVGVPALADWRYEGTDIPIVYVDKNQDVLAGDSNGLAPWLDEFNQHFSLPLGKGYDLKARAFRDKCMEPSGLAKMHKPTLPGQQTLTVHYLTRSEFLNLSEFSDFGGSASFGIGPGRYSLTAAKSSSSAVSTSSKNLEFVGEFRRELPPVAVNSFQMTDAAKKYLGAFKDHCGDAYVSEVMIGQGALFRIHIADKSDSKTGAEIASLSGSGGAVAYAGKIRADFGSFLSSSIQSKEINIEAELLGVNKGLTTDPNELLKAFNDVAGATLENLDQLRWSIIAVMLTPYPSESQFAVKPRERFLQIAAKRMYKYDNLVSAIDASLKGEAGAPIAIPPSERDGFRKIREDYQSASNEMLALGIDCDQHEKCSEQLIPKETLPVVELGGDSCMLVDTSGHCLRCEFRHYRALAQFELPRSQWYVCPNMSAGPKKLLLQGNVFTNPGSGQVPGIIGSSLKSVILKVAGEIADHRDLENDWKVTAKSDSWWYQEPFSAALAVPSGNSGESRAVTLWGEVCESQEGAEKSRRWAGSEFYCNFTGVLQVRLMSPLADPN